MTIKTKAELAAEQTTAEKAANQKKSDDIVKTVTTDICAAMEEGENSINYPILTIPAAAELEIKRAFAAKGWTVSIRRARTGCLVFWS